MRIKEIKARPTKDSTLIYVEVEGNCMSLINEILGSKKQYELDIHQEDKRKSKSQFNMVWAKIQEIANHERCDKYDIYEIMLRRYGQSEYLSVRNEAIKELQKIYPIIEMVDSGKEFSEVKVYKGIEYMNSNELSILTAGVVDEHERYFK